jgi:hypothetical protein
MRPISRFFTTTTAIFGSFWLFSPSSGQDLSTLVGARDPFGLDRVFSFGLGEGAIPGLSTDIKGGVGVGISTSVGYDSNFFHAEHNAESEFIAALTPSVFYNSDPEGGAPTVFSATYNPSYNAYLHHSDLDRFNQSADASLVVRGSRTTLSFVGGYHQISGTDRLAGKFVEGALFNLGLQGSYQLAPRTSLNAGATYSTSTYFTGSIESAEVIGANVGAFWAATERFSLGPAFSYSTTKSDNIGTRDSTSVMAQANYQASEKIHVSGSLGAQFSSNSRDSGGSTAGLTGGLDATYAIDERWAWNASVQYVTVPAPAQTNYVVKDLSMSTRLSRQLKIGVASAGVNYTVSNFESVGPVNSGIGNDRNVSLFLGYSRGFLNDRLGFESTASYLVDRGQTDWNQLLVNMSLHLNF